MFKVSSRRVSRRTFFRVFYLRFSLLFPPCSCFFCCWAGLAGGLFFFLLLACWSGTAAEFFISLSKARDGPSTNASVVSTSEHLSTKGEFGDGPISGFWFGDFATQFVIRIRNSFIYAAALNRKRTGDGVRRFFASL